MQLDGDIYTLLPAAGADPQTRDQVLKIHGENLKTAVQNWNNLASVAFRGVILVAKIAGADVPAEVYQLIPKMTGTD